MTPSQPSSEKPLVCRSEIGLVIVAILLAFGLGMPVCILLQPSTSPGDWVLSILLFVCAGIPAVLLGIHVLRARIIADENGLTFRGIWGQSKIPWRQLEDYELRASSSSGSKSRPPDAYLKIGGEWRSLSRHYAHYDELLERIAQEAKWSQAHSWQLQETREDGDWPKTFVYEDVSGWQLVRICWVFSALFSVLFCLIVLVADSGPRNPTGNSITFWARAQGMLPFFLILSLIWVPALTLVPYAAIKTRRHYLGQRLVATLEGLSYWDGNVESFVSWAEIESYHLETLPGHFQPYLAVIQAPHTQIRFVSGISDTTALLNLVQYRAKNATTKTWEYYHGADEDVLGGHASLWKNGKIGVGPKIHHYRTRIGRSFLFLLAGLSVGMPLPLFLGGGVEDGTLSAGDVIAFITVSAILGVGTILGTCGFFFSSLQCEESGLRQKSIWGERFIAWNEVEEFRFYGLFNALVSQNSKIRFGMVADLKGLCDEIEKRSGVERMPPKNAS